MKLSVVICSGGRPDELKRCLLSLKKQSFKDLETLIIKTKGLARAREEGWRQAKGEIVSFINDDVVLNKDWAKNLVKIFDKDKMIGGVSGPTLVPEDLLKNRAVFWWHDRQDWLARLWVKLMLDNRPFQVGKITKIGWWTPGSNFKDCLKIKGLIGVDYLEACNMSLRRGLIAKAGGFDQNFTGTSEWCEVDLVMRIKQLCYRLVWNRGVKVEHRVSCSGVFANRKNWLERIKNYLYFRKKCLFVRQ